MFVAYIAHRSNFWRISHDLLRCMRFVDLYSIYSIPTNLIEILIVAEDRRYSCHFGIDPIGIFRAIWVNLTTTEFQGASTIEQQFVRVVTGRYEKSVGRKLKEQLLAIALCEQRSKVQIASAYLCIAHYGYRLNGVSGLQSICGQSLTKCSENVLREAVARLKYPEPSIITASWTNQIKLRSGYIEKRMPNRKSGVVASLCNKKIAKLLLP